METIGKTKEAAASERSPMKPSSQSSWASHFPDLTRLFSVTYCRGLNNDLYYFGGFLIIIIV